MTEAGKKRAITVTRCNNPRTLDRYRTMRFTEFWNWLVVLCGRAAKAALFGAKIVKVALGLLRSDSRPAVTTREARVDQSGVEDTRPRIVRSSQAGRKTSSSM